MTSDEKLDYLLELFRKPNRVIYKSMWITILNTISPNEPNFENQKFMYSLFIKKLEADGMIIRNDKKEYNITFKGYFFDGYVFHQLADKALLDKRDLETRTSLRNETLVAVWTIRATWAAGIAAAIVLMALCWDVWKYYHPMPSDGTNLKQIGIFF